MKKHLSYLVLLLLLCTLPQCASHRKVTKVETKIATQTQTTSDTKLSQTRIDSILGISYLNTYVNNNAQDISIKEVETPVKVDGATFISKGKFNFDTTSTKDTIKYIDFDNPEVSLKVYADKKSGEMIAEVKTKDKVIKTPSREVTIKTISSTTKKDSNTVLKSTSVLSKDSISKKDSTANAKITEISKQTDRKSVNIIVPCVVGIVLVAIFLVLLYVKKKL